MGKWHWHDALRLFKSLTPRKIRNLFAITASYFFTRALRRPVVWGKPFSISFEPTTACNLRCPECPSGLRSFTRPTGNLRGDFFRQTLDELHQDLLFLIFYFQGEPYINPEFLEMVRYAHSRRIYTITSTNGHFLNEENARKTVLSGLDRLIISVDGTTQDVYAQYRKSGNLETVLQGARNIVKWKKRLGKKHPHLIFQLLVVQPNEHQIGALYQLAAEIGVDEVKLKTAQVYAYTHGNPLIPTLDKYSRYKKLPDGTYRIKNALLNHCWRLWHACVITWNGIVVPCCFDKDAQHRLGDLKTASFDQIWHGEPYHHFRKQLLLGRKEIDICANCSEGCSVWRD